VIFNKIFLEVWLKMKDCVFPTNHADILAYRFRYSFIYQAVCTVMQLDHTQNQTSLFYKHVIMTKQS